MSQFLTLEEVEHHVSWMPPDAKRALAIGPFEAEDGEEPTECRVCHVLKPLAMARSREALHAMELLGWHELGAVDLFEYADVAGVEMELPDELPNRVLAELMGACSYARCCVIYMTARFFVKGQDA